MIIRNINELINFINDHDMYSDFDAHDCWAENRAIVKIEGFKKLFIVDVIKVPWVRVPFVPNNEPTQWKPNEINCLVKFADGTNIEGISTELIDTIKTI